MLAAGCPAGGITDAGRTRAEQAALYADYLAGRLKATAAKPGTSKHETGRALDLAEPARSWVRTHGAPFGWVRDRVKNEPWHLEYQADKDQRAKAAPAAPKAETGDDDMFVLIQPEKGYWLVGPGFAHQLNGEEWNEAVGKLRDAGIVKQHIFEAGPVGQRRFDVTLAAFTQNDRAATAASAGGVTPAQVADEFARRLAS